MRAAYLELELGRFNLSAEASKGLLATLQDSVDRSKNCHYVANYLLAAKLASKIEDLASSGEKEKASVLAFALAELPLHGRHRWPAMRWAVSLCIAAENYGLASTLIKAMLNKGSNNPDSLRNMLNTCESNACSNTEMASTILTYPRTSEGRLPLSAVSLEIVRDLELNCATCGAAASSADMAGLESPNTCSHCGWGQLSKFSV
tara:strand:- start:24 stop:635 length:612 start_codon:yes stop_codon:yes gene_type:complete